MFTVIIVFNAVMLVAVSGTLALGRGSFVRIFTAHSIIPLYVCRYDFLLAAMTSMITEEIGPRFLSKGHLL